MPATLNSAKHVTPLDSLRGDTVFEVTPKELLDLVPLDTVPPLPSIGGEPCTEVWAPEPASGEAQLCRDASILGSDFIDFPPTEALKNLSFVFIGTPAALTHRVETAIAEHAGSITNFVGPSTTHIVIWTPHPFQQPTGISWGVAQSHPQIKAAYAEREARKTRTTESSDGMKPSDVYFVHPGFFIECMRRGVRVPEDKFDLEKVVAPQFWNWQSK